MSYEQKMADLEKEEKEAEDLLKQEQDKDVQPEKEIVSIEDAFNGSSNSDNAKSTDSVDSPDTKDDNILPIAESAKEATATDVPDDKNGKVNKPDEQDKDVNYWRSRFLTTEGILKKTSTELKDLKGTPKDSRIEELEKRLEDFSKATPKTIDAEKVDTLKDILADDFEDDENMQLLAEKMQKYVKSELNVSSKEYNKVIDELKEELSSFKNQSTEDKFWNDVYNKSPYAESIVSTENDAFSVWLDEPLKQGFSITRRKFFNDGTAKDVAKLFDEYNSDTKKTTTTNTESIPEAVTNQSNIRPNQKSQSLSNDVQIIPMSSVEEFYSKDMKGLYSIEDSNKYNDLIDLAIAEGRIDSTR